MYDHIKNQSAPQSAPEVKNITSNPENNDQNPSENPIGEKTNHTLDTLVKYSVPDEEKLFSENILKAELDGKTYIVISKKDEIRCLEIVDQRDYDGNGTTDALLSFNNTCGGNCCANSFFFVSYLKDGHFQKSDAFGYSWANPNIKKWKQKWSVLVTSNNEGVNNNPAKEIIERFVLDSGKAIKVEESERKEIISIVELRSDQFDFDKENQIKIINFDLDGDQIEDKIETRFWHRWGRLLLTVNLSSGYVFKSNFGCKRIGVLPTKSNSVNDLVCDQDSILRWNGSEYK